MSYLLKNTPSERILECIAEVHEGGAPMTPAIARRVVQTMYNPPKPESISVLTNRETEVITLLSEGLSYKMVAVKPEVGLETIRTHVKRIYEKLQAHSVTEAIAKYSA